jgi:hypothetical protein
MSRGSRDVEGNDNDGDRRMCIRLSLLLSEYLNLSSVLDDDSCRYFSILTPFKERMSIKFIDWSQGEYVRID